MTTYNSTAVWSFEKEVDERTFLDWLAAHTSFCLPLHHYEGDVSLDSSELVFKGHHKKNKNQNAEVRIPFDKITDLHHGFDDHFRRGEDRGLGIAFKPLRISFVDNESQAQNLYVVVNFHNVSNGILYDILDNLTKKGSTPN